MGDLLLLNPRMSPSSPPLVQGSAQPSPEGRAKEERGGSVVLAGQIVRDEFAQPFEVLAVQFNVVVASALHPEGLDSLRAALVEGQTMGEVNHLILRAVDEEDRGGDPRHFVNAVGGKTQKKKIKLLP